MKARDRLLAIFFVIGLIMFTQGLLADTVWDLHSHDIARVYDGDTFYIDLAGLPPVFGEELPIRLLNVDTPELRSRCDTLALKEEEKRLGRLSRDFLIDTLKGAGNIRLETLERGSFFRVVADVYVDEVWLNKLMVEKGHAVDAYDGKSADWCDIIEDRWADQ
jgi:endonuclease YncB( thermonuclease family)